MIKLRPYQEESVESACDSLIEKGSALVVLPTGSGKTVVISKVIERFKVPTLIVAHTRELVDQIKSAIPEYLKPIVVVTTIQSLSSRALLPRFDMLVVDECHRAASATYQRLIERKPKYVIGCTATPYRMDRKSIYEIFGFPAEQLSMIDLIEKGFLCDIRGYRIKTNVSLINIKRAASDFNGAKLCAIINVKSRNTLIVKSYLDFAKGKKALAFCVNVSHASDLCGEFNAQGIRCECIHGKLDKNKRKQILKEFRDGRISVLCNCNILTEGYDEPSIECLLMCRPTLSKTLYVQMLGRGVRNFPGKQYCEVVEFTDNEFDVCHLGSLLDSSMARAKIHDGESLSSFRKRVAKELVDGTGDLVKEEFKIIVPKNIVGRPATPYQMVLLKRFNIEYNLPLSEYEANLLLKRENGNIHEKSLERWNSKISRTH